MIQKTFMFSSIEDFRAVAKSAKESSAYQSARHSFLQLAVFCARPFIQSLQRIMQEELPDVALLGATNDDTFLHDGEHPQQRGTFCFFDEAEFSIRTYNFLNLSEKDAGLSLHQHIKELPYTKGVLIYTAGLNRNIAQFLDNAVDSNNTIPLFGMNAGTPLTGTSTETAPLIFTEQENEIFTEGAIAVILRGRNLHIRTATSFGWQPLGKELEITGTDGPLCVSSIDDMPGTYIYELYLHVKPDEHFMANVSEFPLLLTERYGAMQARVPLRCDAEGKLYFAADIQRGEKIRLTYGNIRHVLSESRQNSNALYRFGTQALFLYICSIRSAFLKQASLKELSYFRRAHKDLFFSHGWGEILKQQTGGLLNASLVAVSMHEGSMTLPKEDCNPPEQLEPAKLTMPLSSRLLSFLETTNKEMKESSEAKSNFLSNMSHEIRTPINAVLGLDEMILRETHDAAIKNYALDIQRAGKMLLSLINDILDFSKIEANKLDIVNADYDLSNTITDLVNMALPSVQRKNLAFNVHVSPEIPHKLNGDEGRIKQCILNILTNAIKYTHTGSITLSMQSHKQDEETIQLTVRVVDTGIGIQKSDLRKLFSPFERIEESRNRNIEGTGLGMSIVKGLLSKMNSNLIVKSEYGHGSDFSFTILQKVCSWEPIGDYKATQTKIAEQTVNQYHESFQAPNAKILVVDDMATNLTVICGLLKNTRIQFDTAQNAGEALSLLQKNKYDILLVDHLMPQMDGIQMLHVLRKNEHSPNRNTVAIALTANALVGAKEMYLAEGFENYLSKPVEGKILEAMLKRYLPTDLILLPGNDGFINFEAQNQDTSELSGASAKELGGLFSELFGIHIEQALKNCGTKDVFLEAVDTFCSSIQRRADDIERFAAQKNYKEFTVQVHGLKSSARLIGLDELSCKAAELESLGDAQDGDSIVQKTPALLLEYRALEKTLEPLCKRSAPHSPQGAEESAKPELSKEDLQSALLAIQEYARAFDFTGAKAVLEALEAYHFPADFSQAYKTMQELVQVGDQAALLTVLKELQ